jgi:hypothetical protein
VATLGSITPLPTSALPVVKPSPPGVEDHPLVGIPEGTLGPFLARRGDVVMSAYVGASSEGVRRVVSVPLASDGDVRDDARVIAKVPSDATMLTLFPSGGDNPGFIAAWSYLTDRGEALATVAVHDDGRPRGTPIELERTGDDIVWVSVVPTSKGAVALWAEQTHDGDANILGVALASDGAMRGLPARIAHGVTGWQVVSAPYGAALALVTPVAAAPPSHPRGSKASPDEGAPAGPDSAAVSVLRVDVDAKAMGAPVVLAPRTHLRGDVEEVRVGDQTIFAWTDITHPDPQPVLAALDANGKLHPPQRAIVGGSGGTVVGLAGGGAEGALAWEEPFRRGRSGRRITLARVDPATVTLDASAQASVEIQGRGAPEITDDSGGFALLAPARTCVENEPCGDPPPIPTYIRFDDKLAIAQVEPLRLGLLRENAESAWGLTCGSRCLALATAPPTEASPAPRIVSADLRHRTTPFHEPSSQAAAAGAPTIDALDTIAAGAPYADLSATRFGDGTAVAFLAATNDETAQRDDTAIIGLRSFDAASGPLAQSIVTKRALPVGGLSIAATDRAEDGTAIAWVARDGGDPQVHVTRLDGRGKVVHDQQLTSVKGDASDVAIVWSGEKWIVAWVDTRDGNGEVYATTLDRDGRNVGKGQRITTAPGDATDVFLLALPQAVGPDGRGVVWVAWADPRESPNDGFSDVYVAQLKGRDASRVGNEVRVLATAAHSRSPALAAKGADVGLSWIEEAPSGADPEHALAYGAMFTWLGPEGHPSSEPVHLRVGGDGFPTSVALDGSKTTLHAVLARAAKDMIVLDGLDIAHDAAASPAFPLVTLDGPPSLDVALGPVGDALFFNDEAADGASRRVRRATVRWRR